MANTVDCGATVAVDTSGNVYIVDSHGNCIQKFTSERVITTWHGN
ncbi:hypothetical protein [Candidatus Magnetobacterium casense]